MPVFEKKTGGVACWNTDSGQWFFEDAANIDKPSKEKTQPMLASEGGEYHPGLVKAWCMWDGSQWDYRSTVSVVNLHMPLKLLEARVKVEQQVRLARAGLPPGIVGSGSGESGNACAQLEPAAGMAHHCKPASISKAEFTVGRKDDCDAVVVGDSSVSKLHFRILTTTANQVTIVDCSSNGTTVNGVALTKGMVWPLKSGDQIAMSAKEVKGPMFIFKAAGLSSTSTSTSTSSIADPKMGLRYHCSDHISTLLFSDAGPKLALQECFGRSTALHAALEYRDPPISIGVLRLIASVGGEPLLKTADTFGNRPLDIARATFGQAPRFLVEAQLPPSRSLIPPVTSQLPPSASSKEKPSAWGQVVAPQSSQPPVRPLPPSSSSVPTSAASTASEPPKCPQAHAMERKTIYMQYDCGRCGVDYKTGHRERWHCGFCGYDVCFHCVPANLQPASRLPARTTVKAKRKGKGRRK